MNPRNLSGWFQHAQLDEAATLAFIRQGPHDIGPELLLLFHAQDGEKFRQVHSYGVRYLDAWVSHTRTVAPPDALRLAAGDALAILWCRRAPQSVAARAKNLHMRSSAYYRLRSAALEMYQRRLYEARLRFLLGTIDTRHSLDWEIGRAPPRPSCAAPGNAQLLFNFGKAA